MKVFKFGGASINSIERIQEVGKIIQSFKGEKLLIIISAMGKITNALENVASAFYAGDKEEARRAFVQLRQSYPELTIGEVRSALPHTQSYLNLASEGLDHLGMRS